LANDEIQNLLRTAIQAAQSGNKMIARGILEQVIDQDPDNEVAWLWLASVVDDTEERRGALERVLRINPNNERAQQAMASLRRSTPLPEPQVEPEPVPSRPAPAQPAPPRAAPRQARASQMDRGPLLGGRPSQRRQGRLSPVMFTLIALLAIGMFAAAIYLLWSDQQSTDNKPTATPRAQATIQAAINATQTAILSLFPPTPSLTPRPLETLPPTNVPTATHTATNTPTPTSTPLPLTDFSLLVSGQRASEARWALYTMSADGTQEQQVPLSLPQTETPLALIEVYDGAYSPDGAQIAFTARFSADGVSSYEELCVAPAGGGNIQCLTSAKAEHVESATWSPDSQRIAFASDADGDYEIYVIASEGGDSSRLTDNDAQDREPAWSPTADVIAYGSDLGQLTTLEIWRMNADGQNRQQLTENENSSYAPAWSPDGGSIAFVSTRRVNADLYVMTADGLGERALFVRDVPAEERNPSWSPNGYWIAFSSNREGPIFDVYVIRPDGTELQRITSGGGDTGYVVWKP
jgi:hypothetical protein